jgi:hypothetical protein
MMIKPRSNSELKRALTSGTLKCGEIDDVTGRRCRATAVGLCTCGAAYCGKHSSGMHPAPFCPPDENDNAASNA